MNDLITFEDLIIFGPLHHYWRSLKFLTDLITFEGLIIFGPLYRFWRFLKVLTNLIIFELLTWPVHIKDMAHSDLWLHYRKRERTSQVTTLSFTQGIPPSVISTPQFTWRGYHQARDLRGGFRICPLAGSARSFLNVLLPASDEQCFHFLKVKASRGALTIPLAWWELRLSKTL